MTPEQEKELRAYFAGRGPVGIRGQRLFAEIDALRDLLAQYRAELARAQTEEGNLRMEVGRLRVSVINQGYSVAERNSEIMALRARLQEHPANLPTVLQAAWNDTFQQDDQSSGGAAYTERALLLTLAEKLGVTINRDTPTPKHA